MTAEEQVQVRDQVQVTKCPMCSAYSLTPNHQRSTLIAVCDVLVLKSLELIGKRIVRASRDRFRLKGTRPWHIMHTLWQPDDEMVSKSLKGAWDVVPALIDAHGCCGVTAIQVSWMLDSYVHDLVITGTPHSLDELHFRFENKLNLPIEVQHA